MRVQRIQPLEDRLGFLGAAEVDQDFRPRQQRCGMVRPGADGGFEYQVLRRWIDLDLGPAGVDHPQQRQLNLAPD